MQRKPVIVFTSVKGHMGKMWAKVVYIVGDSTISILPKYIWKTDFSLRDGFHRHKYGSIPLSVNCYRWHNSVWQNERSGLLETSGTIISHSWEKFTGGQLFSLLLDTHKESMKPQCFHFTTMKESQLQAEAHALKEQSRRKKPGSLMIYC